MPKQGWSGAGADPSGGIFVGGMDHVGNAALYRLPAGESLQPGSAVSYVGDARAASRTAGNLWPRNEPIEKFHTQPQFYRGRVFVANMNYSNLDAGYRQVRGFHWYAHDQASGRFLDLSATQPGGVALARGGLPGMTIDTRRGLIYGLVTPTGELVQHSIANGRTRNLGRPAWGRSYLYPARALWVGSTGRVYFTAGNPNPGTRSGGPYDAARFNHVRFWDPIGGFGEEKSWQLHDTRALDYAACFDVPAPRTCWLMDNVGHVYRYREGVGRPTFSRVGNIGQQRDELYGLTWVFQVRPDQTKSYIVARRGAILALDLATGRAELKGNLWELEPALAGQDFFGNSAWDKHGRFYFAAYPKSFSGPITERTRLVAIDPGRFLAPRR